MYYNNTNEDNLTEDVTLHILFIIPAAIFFINCLLKYVLCRPDQPPNNLRDHLRRSITRNRDIELNLQRINYQEDTQNIECSICLEKYVINEELILLHCNHLFHSS